MVTATPLYPPTHWSWLSLLAALACMGGCPADDEADGDSNAEDADVAIADGNADTSGVDTPAGSDTTPGEDTSEQDDPGEDTVGQDTMGDDTPGEDASDDSPGAATCNSGVLATRMGTDRLLVGGTMDDESFEAAPFTIRYVYLAGQVPETTCADCAEGCIIDEVDCDNEAPGCNWWGCWQYDQVPPGQYVRDFITTAQDAGAVPMFSYYVWYTIAGRVEAAAEILALQDGDSLRRYLIDWRFFCETAADAAEGPVILHAEPDLWGFGQQVNEDPEAIPVALADAEIAECAGLGDSLAGLAQCMRQIAEGASDDLVFALHASAWGAGADALINTEPDFDLVQHGHDTANYMAALGASSDDLIVVEMSDRDAGYNDRWWDETDASLPNFEQALTWSSTVAEDLGAAFLWWQVPYGNEALDDTCNRYRDNRVDYFFDHPDAFASAGSLGIAFGGGAECMTNPADDDGHFLSRATDYFAGDQACQCGVCP